MPRVHPKNTKADSIPMLDIREYLLDQQAEPGFQYHEIHGKRLIEQFHRHDFFQFLLIEKGSGVHAIDFTDHAVKDHQVHIMFPHQVHRWELGSRTRACQLMISQKLFETFSSSLSLSFLLYQSHPVVNLTLRGFQLLWYEFQAIHGELQQKPVNWDLIYLRSNIIAQLVNREAEQQFAGMSQYRGKPVLGTYLSLIEEHFRDEKSVAFYAQLLHLTPNYLNILCKRHFNKPAMFFIQKRVTLEAKRMILTSDRSLKEIAYQLGFNDAAYFSNFFKIQTGSSPREFRDQL